MNEPFPALPALKALGTLSELRPTVVIDSREQTPLVFARLKSVTAGLQSGDYSFLGGEELFAVERKSVSDLVGCCTGDNRARFERELHRLRGFKFARLLVIGHPSEVSTGRYFGGIAPGAVLASLATWEARFIPVAWAPDPEAAARQVESWVFRSAVEIVKAANQLLRSNRESTQAISVFEPHPSTKAKL